MKRDSALGVITLGVIISRENDTNVTSDLYLRQIFIRIARLGAAKVKAGFGRRALLIKS
jgi:hypothetical protein